MDEFIDRQEFLEAQRHDDLVKRLRTECTLPFQTLQLMREAADVIEELSNEYEKLAEDFNGAVELLHKRSEPSWIPVTERLPGREWVLCKCRSKIHEVLSLRDGYWYHDPQHKYMSGFVTHWMPLPPAPKEE